MDSRDNNAQQPHRPLPGMMMGPTSYPTNPASHHLMNPNSSSSMMQPRFNFNSVVAPPPSSEPMESMGAAASGLYDGSSPSGFSIEPAKKKRGRPRKYAPEGNIALGLGPASTPPSSAGHVVGPSSPPSEPQSKKHRGRPPGSGKKQLDALGSGGVGFTPHVILVKSGEDIASKIAAFSQQGPRTVCILSANGAVCNVSLKQPALSGAAVSYEGRYEIISLSGSFVYVESDSSDHQNRNSGLSVSLAGSDGRVLGGGVAGMLIAATPVQVIVGSFIMEGGKKSSTNTVKSEEAVVPSGGPPPPQTVSFGGVNQQMLAIANPPPSQEEGGSSESSDEGGGSGSSPINNNNNNHPSSGGAGVYYNNVSHPNMQQHQHQQQHQQQQQQMFNHHPHHIWASQAHR